MNILFIFIDGVGIGDADPEANPLMRHPDLWPSNRTAPKRKDIQWRALDATLGIDGLPQSATGQTALLTGVNASRYLGKHLQGFPSKKLVELLQSESIFIKLNKLHKSAIFANAYREPEDVEPQNPLSVTSHAYRAVGKPFQSLEDLRQGRALYHDFTNENLRKRGYDAPEIIPEEAARTLLDIAQKHDFTLYEHFLTDVIAHRSTRDQIDNHIESVCRFLRTILDERPIKDLFIIITSDHGNIESRESRSHTTNPVPLIWTEIEGINLPVEPESITGITPWILQIFMKNELNDEALKL